MVETIFEKRRKLMGEPFIPADTTGMPPHEAARVRQQEYVESLQSNDMERINQAHIAMELPLCCRVYQLGIKDPIVTCVQIKTAHCSPLEKEPFYSFSHCWFKQDAGSSGGLN